MRKFFIILACLFVSFVAWAQDECAYKSSIEMAQEHNEHKMSCVFAFGARESYMEKLRHCSYGRRKLDLSIDTVGTMEIMYMQESTIKDGSVRQFKLDIVTSENQKFSCYYTF
jgi:hypothetical protein